MIKANYLFKKYLLAGVYLLTNVAMLLFAVWSDAKQNTSAGSIPLSLNNIVYVGNQVLGILLALIIGPSVVFHIAARHALTNAMSIGVFVTLNVLLAAWCSNQALTQGSSVFFFAIHWVATWVLAITAAATIRPPHKADAGAAEQGPRFWDDFTALLKGISWPWR